MKDIDRNINAIVNSHIVQIIDISSFDASKYTLVVRAATNYTENKATQILSYRLTPGIYYYKHSLRKVENNNAQCLFMLITNSQYSNPFYSYYAQSPIETDYPEIVTQFLVTQETNFLITKTLASSNDFKMNGFIEIFKRNE